MRRGLLLALSVALVVSPQVFGQSKDHSANGLELKGVFTPGQAMKLVYGSYDPDREVSQWTPNQAKSYPPAWPDKIEVQLVFDASYIEAGVPKHLLVTSALPRSKDPSEYSCHSCGTLMGFVLFTKTSDAWEVEASDLQFGYFGQFGLPPTVSLQLLGHDRYGIFIPTFFGATGDEENTITIIISNGHGFLKAIEGEIAESRDYGCSGTATEEEANGCVQYDGAFDLVPASGSEYYDLLLARRVYRSFSSKDPVRTTVTRLHFDGSKYVPVGQATTTAPEPPD